MSTQHTRKEFDGRSGAEALVTVIMPVFNERNCVAKAIARVLSAPFNKQLIIVDDGSTDGTSEVIRKWKGVDGVSILAHPKNQGKGAAIRSALAMAKGDSTVIQDADLEYDPNDIVRLIAPLQDGAIDVVFGSRYLNSQYVIRHGAVVNRFAVGVLNAIVRWVYGVRLSDEATCYKAVRTTLLRRMNLECNRFEFCSEVTAKACRMGLRICEVPVHYDARSRRAGKKVRWTDGIWAAIELWKWRHWNPQYRRAATIAKPLDS